MRQRFGEQCGFVAFGALLVIVFIQELTKAQISLHGKVVVLAAVAHGAARRTIMTTRALLRAAVIVTQAARSLRRTRTPDRLQI
jgi:hypothetical protein